MPTPKKPIEKRQRRNADHVGVLTAVPDATVPDLPPGRHLKATEQWWQELWTSSVARLIDPASDLRALHRLVRLYDELGRLQNHVDKHGRLAFGSTGQPTLAPLYKHMVTIENQINALEDRFGLTPLARLKLGATLGAASQSLDKMNQELAKDGADDGDEDEDPRLAAAITTTARATPAG